MKRVERKLRDRETLTSLVEQVSKFLGVTYSFKTSKATRRISSEKGLTKLFRTYFLPRILPKEIEEELTYFFLYKFYTWRGEHEKVEKVLENWSKLIKKIYQRCEDYDVSFEVHEGIEKLRIRFSSGTVYYPMLEILKIDSVLEGKLLKILLETLYRSSKLLREKIKVEDFCGLLWETLKTPYNLSENELRVLDVLIGNPRTKVEEISRLTRLSSPSVALILKRLEKGQAYTANSIIKFDKLGLKHVIVRIPSRKEPKFPHQLSRYLLSLQYVLGDREEHLASFVLPAKHIRSAKKLLINSFGKRIKIYEVEDLQFSVCLDYYDCKSHKWKINYEKLVEKVEKQISRKRSKELEKEQKKETVVNENKFTFDRKDLKILRILIRNWRLSLRELSKIVKLSKSAVHKRVSKLENQKVFEPIINVHRIGLTEDIALIVKSGNVAFLDSLTHVLKKLPRITIYKLREKKEERSKHSENKQQHLFWLTLPSGDTIKFLKNFPPIIEKYGDSEVFYRWHFYSWISFPDPELYLEKQKAWKWY